MRNSFLLLMCVATSILAAPRLKEVKKDVPSIAGTSWTGKTAEGWDMTVEFRTDGRMTVTYNGTSFDKATWRQDGDKIYYEMNDKYCEFEGKLAGDVIAGGTHNVRGRMWETRLTRIGKDK